MEPADWLHRYLDGATAGAVPVVWSAADEDTTPVDAVEHATALHARSRVPRRGRSRRSRCARTSSRPGSFLERRPPARARSARLREPARVRHVHEPARAALRPRRRPRARGRARARRSTAPMLDWCSVDPRLLPVTVVPVGDMRRRGRARRAKRSTAAARRDLDRPVLPAGPLAEPRRRSNRCGRCARRRACRSCCTSRARARNVMAPDYFDNGLPAGSRLPRRRHELQVDRLPVDPAAGDADAERA